MTSATRPVSDAHPQPQSATFRPDIQALRALAVSLVLVYHLWPQTLTGGYVGVDVFFVISGFLITSHLLSSGTNTAHGVLEFWGRRVRRLLPASLLVLTVTLLATRLVAPDTLWESTASQVRAAATYSLNWQLAKNSVDYLAAQSTPTPVIHFWSLSVEEQFYAAWPILLLILTRLSTRRRVVTAGIALVCAVSFAYSVYYTGVEPARAYFITPTRIWELAAGGVLAAIAPAALTARKGLSHIVAGTGLAGIAVAAITFSATTRFPGWLAAVPVLSAVALIWAQPSWPALSTRPVQWLGDISYSLYLWHWPLIVLVPYLTGNQLRWPAKTLIIITSLALAGLTKHYVEDLFRRPRRQPRRRLQVARPFAVAAAGMVVVVAAASIQTAEVHSREAAATQAVGSALAGNASCFGAETMVRGADCTRATVSGTLVPAPIQAAKDLGPAWSQQQPGAKDCFANPPSFPSVQCQFGATTSNVRVALIGNSHAGQWVAAMQAIATSQGWHVTTYLALGCALSSVLQHFATSAQDHACYRWVQRTDSAVSAGHYNLVVMSDRDFVPALGKSYAASLPVYQRGDQKVLRSLAAAREPVVVIRDTPYPGTSVPNCLAQHTSDYLPCGGSREKWLAPDPTISALKALHKPRDHIANLTDYLCEKTLCPAAIGGVPVYFDGSHITATFSRTMAPYLEPYLTSALSPQRPRHAPTS